MSLLPDDEPWQAFETPIFVVQALVLHRSLDEHALLLCAYVATANSALLKLHEEENTSHDNNFSQSSRFISTMSDELAPSHEYQHIGEGEIRLLELEPSLCFHNKIVGTLHKVELFDSSFEALSYAWGDGMVSRKISCDSVAVSIAANWDTALRYLRLKKRSRRLWVDGLCINQSDVIEKESQVRLMPDIYREARRCIIWLGEATADTKDLFRAARLCRLLPDPVSVPFKVHFKISLLLKNLGVHSAAVRGFRDLAQRSWFQRLWTIQELLLNGEPYLACGVHSVSWRHMEELKGWMYTDIADEERWRFGLRMWFQAGVGPHSCSAASFAPILIKAKNSYSSDPRDKVMGALPIFERVGLGTLELSYSHSVQHIYAAATRALFTHDDDLEFLNLACTTRITPGLPSWTIDWASVTEQDEILSCNHYMGNLKRQHPRKRYKWSKYFSTNGKPFSASRFSPAWTSIVRDSHDISVLRCRGIIVDRFWDGYSPRQFAMDLYAPATTIVREAVPYLALAARVQHRTTQSSMLRKLIVLLQEKSTMTYGLSMRHSIDALEDFLAPKLHTALEIHQSMQDDDDQLSQAAHAAGMFPHPEMDSVGEYSLQLSLVISANEALFVTQDHGHFGLCFCQQLCKGDLVAVVAGADFPLVLRQTNVEGSYTFVRPAFMPDLIRGQAWPENAVVENMPIITLV